MPKQKKKSEQDLDEQFDAFLEASLSDEDDSTKIKQFLEPKQKETKPWWSRQDSSDEEDRDFGAKKSFMKKKPDESAKPKKKTPQPSPRPSPRTHIRKKDLESSLMSTGVDISRDSLEADVGTKDRFEDTDEASYSRYQKNEETLEAVHQSHYNMTQPGLDTLDEMADKERFFKELEANADSTVDYAKLNRKLEITNTMGTLDKIGTGKETEDSAWMPARGSDEYNSEEFEDEEISYKTDKSNSDPVYTQSDVKRPSMLSKVSLMDSTMESTMATNRLKQVNYDEISPDAISKSGKTGFSDTTSQEIEALQKVLQQAGASTLESGDKDASPLHSVHSYRDYSQKYSHVASYKEDNSKHNISESYKTKDFAMKTISDKPSRTVEDILKEVEAIEKRSELSGQQVEHLMSIDVVGASGDTRNVLDLSPIPRESNVWDLMPEDNDIKPVSAVSEERPNHQEYRPSKKKSRSKYSEVKSSGYGPRWIPSKGSTYYIPTQQQQWSPADTTKSKIKGTQMLKKDGKLDTTLQDSQLEASVQAFAEYIQDHFTSPQAKKKQSDGTVPMLQREQCLNVLEREKGLLREVKEWQEQWKEERKQATKVKADILFQEKDYARKIDELRIQYEEEIFKLKQENFVLSAKISTDDVQTNTKKKVLDGGSIDTANSEQVKMMEKEIREQEKLLAGYQQENERLYKEMKRLQVLQKVTEDKMYKENQRLAGDVTHLRALIDRKDIQLKSLGIITSPLAQQQIASGQPGTTALGAGRIAELNVELKQAKLHIAKLEDKVYDLEKGKNEMEEEINMLVRSQEKVHSKVEYDNSHRQQMAQDSQRKYEVEIERLTKKLKWYAENQEILDRDNELLKEKNAQIRQLNKKIQELEKQYGIQHSEQKQKSREKNTEKENDAKKIKDLQRQVKEMETIIKKRHPNSIHSLIWAANMVPDDHPVKPETIAFLEGQIRKLEGQLDDRDEEAKRDLRAMEQKYNAVKYQYETRISELENKVVALRAKARFDESSKGDEIALNQSGVMECHHPKTNIVTLERELESVRSRYKQELSDLKEEIESLQQELSLQRNKTNAKIHLELNQTRESEREAHEQLKAVKVELGSKDKEIISLHKSIERLQAEKQQLLRNMNKQLVLKGGKSGKGKKNIPVPLPNDEAAAGILGKYYGQEPKEYEPRSFAGSHIEDVLRENDGLKLKVDRLELELDHQRVDLNKALAEAESAGRKSHDDAEEEIQTLKRLHQRNIERIMAENAKQHAHSEVADMQSKINTLEIMLKHLKGEQSQWAMDKEQVSAMKVRNAAIETQIGCLLEELKEAKSSHTPEMRHFESILEKIKHLESRHAERETQLKQIIQGQYGVNNAATEEMEKWKMMVQQKTLEVERFKTQLDSILETLRQLKRQGVVIPYCNEIS